MTRCVPRVAERVQGDLAAAVEQPLAGTEASTLATEAPYLPALTRWLGRSGRKDSRIVQRLPQLGGVRVQMPRARDSARPVPGAAPHPTAIRRCGGAAAARGQEVARAKRKGCYGSPGLECRCQGGLVYR